MPVVSLEAPLAKGTRDKEAKAMLDAAAGHHAAGDDAQVPAGDSPPLPRWPLVVAALAWGGWLVFLVAMMLLRLSSSGG